MPDFGSHHEGEPWEGKRKQRDPTRLCSEHLCPKHVDMGWRYIQWNSVVIVCG